MSTIEQKIVLLITISLLIPYILILSIIIYFEGFDISRTAALVSNLILKLHKTEN